MVSVIEGFPMSATYSSMQALGRIPLAFYLRLGCEPRSQRRRVLRPESARPPTSIQPSSGEAEPSPAPTCSPASSSRRRAETNLTGLPPVPRLWHVWRDS